MKENQGRVERRTKESKKVREKELRTKQGSKKVRNAAFGDNIVFSELDEDVVALNVAVEDRGRLGVEKGDALCDIFGDYSRLRN